MKRSKRFFSVAVAFLLTVFTFISYLPAKTASAAVVVPKIQFASPPVTQYMAGDRVNFNINAPNYGGRVQYRVVLWNDSEKTYYDLWNASNGYPNKYYTKWQPYGNNIFTLGWIIFDPGSYRITVYAKRAGIANSKTALKGFNCDSYMESVAFTVKSKEAAVSSILPLSDVTVMQGATPILPTKVKAAMSDGLIKEFGVTWGAVNTSNPGTFTIEGTVAGTTKKASIKVNVTAQTAINVHSVVSVSNYLVNVTLKDAISKTPETSKFSIKSYNSNTAVTIQSVSLSSDKKSLALTTSYMATNSWYTLTVNNNNYNFIGNQGTGSGISLAAQNKEVAVGATIYPTVTQYPSDVTLRYSSSNSNIATVNQTSGLITGKTPGVATITVTGSKYGYTTVSTTFTVTVGGQSGVYAYAQNMEIGVGTQQLPVITKYPYDLILYFTSSNPRVATVNSSTGLVTGVAQGVATITISAYNYGYSTVTSTFTVTVGYQGVTISASPTRLYEATSNDGSLTSGVIDVYLTGGTFSEWGGYNYYENYVDVDNLPYGMSFTAAYVNSNRIRVTITGKARSHRSSDDVNIRIVVGRDLVYGANYDLTSNNILLDFSDYTIPAAPTNPVVNDVKDTFGWTYVPGYGDVSDYEYRVKNGSTWSGWTICTEKPISIGDNYYASGAVEVRVKAASGSDAGYALASNKAFTKTADAIVPQLKTLTMTFTKGDGIYNISPSSGGNYNVPTILGALRELAGMEINVEDNNLNTNPVNIYYANSTTRFGTLKHGAGTLWKLDMTTCTSKVLDESIALEATFTDGTNDRKATINITVLTITKIDDIEKTVLQDSVYDMPDKVTATMSYGEPRQVAVDWDGEIDTSKPEVQVVLGTVVGYEPETKVKLTVTVTPTATIVRIPDIADTVEEGTEYIMPTQVVAFMSDGKQRLVDVKVWDKQIDATEPGTYYALGTVAGYSKAVKLTVIVTAATIINIEDFTITTEFGKPFEMPTHVTAQMSNGKTREVDITWVPETINMPNPGVYGALGTVVGYNGIVKLTVIVTEAQPTSRKTR